MRRAGQSLTRVFGNGQFCGVVQIALTDPCYHGNEVRVAKRSEEADSAEFPRLVARVLYSKTRDTWT